MKKSLLKVAASIIGLLGCNAALASGMAPNDPVSPVHEGLYYIFDAHAINDGTTDEQDGGDNCRYAFRFDSGNDNGDIHGTHAKPYNVCAGTTTLTNSHVWKVTTADGGQTWSFQNMGTNKWIKGDACATSADESAKGLFVIEGESANAFKIRVNGNGNNRWDGNGGGDYPMVYWGGAGHPIRFYEAVSDGNGGYSIASSNACDVTYTFTRGNLTYTYPHTVPVAVGANAAWHIPAVDFFTTTGVQGTETTVSENAKTFTVTGTWNLPENNAVYRVRNRVSNGENYVYVDGNGGIKANSTTVDVELEKTGLWYFRFINFDADGHLICTMHSLSNLTEGVGVTFEDNNSGHAATLTDNPTQLTMLPSEGTDFALKFTLNGNEHFVNNRSGNFSSWTVAAGAYAGETGCVVRAMALTENDFTALAITATEDEINNAKANPTPEAISVLIDKCTPLAKAIAATKSYPIGTGLGQYNNAAGDFEAKLAEARALLTNTSATEAEINAAIEAIAVSNLSLNMPKPGRFYRFHYGDKYLSSNINTAQSRFAIETQANSDALNNTTVFYYDDDSHLVTYPEGLVMGNMVANTTCLKGVSVTDSNAGTIRFDESAFEKGKYNIISDTNTRYLYHRDTYTDSGNSNAATDDDAGYRWEITEVTWLPTPYSGSGYLSICVPVDLDFTTWPHATPYIGVLQGENVGKKAAGETVPANTPVILEVRESSNSCVYVHVSYSEISAQAADDTNSLATAGNYAGAAKEDGQSYFKVDGESFVPAGDTLPAFAAVLKVPTAEAKAGGYAITEYDPSYVSITEIESAANTGKQVIYDLQGRRVQRASKGLYIINGVKTLVK